MEGVVLLHSIERWEGVIRLEDVPSLDVLARTLVPRLIELGRYQKRTILAVADFGCLFLALWLAMSLRLGELYVAPTWPLTAIFCAAPVIGVATFFYLGLYRLVTRFIGGQGAMLIVVAVGLSTLVWSLVLLLSGITGVPRSVVVTYPILGGAFVLATRQAAGWVLKRAGIERTASERASVKRVLIYGAGTTGVQLLEALRLAPTYVPVGFVDASPTIWGQYVGGLKVMRPERMPGVIEQHDVSEVLLAMPKARRPRASRGAAPARDPGRGCADAAGHGGPGGGPRDGQRPAPRGGGGPARPRSGASQRGRCWRATSRTSPCW